MLDVAAADENRDGDEFVRPRPPGDGVVIIVAAAAAAPTPPVP